MKVGDGAVRRMILVLVWIAAAHGTWAAADGKMNLAFGWEFRQLTVRQLIGAADEFAKLLIDGVELHLKTKNAAGEPMGSKTIMEGSVWTKSEYGAFDGDDPTGWRRGFAFARAPADAATLVVLLNAEGQSPDELATFRDVKACLLKDIGQ